MTTVRTSPSARLSVLAPAAIEGTGWTIKFVSDIDGETVWAHTANWIDASFSDDMSDLGGFTITMRATDPLWARPLPGAVAEKLLEREPIVQFVQDGVIRFEGILEDVAPDEVSEAPGRIILSGRGIGAVLERSIVIPADLDDPFAFMGFTRNFTGPGMAAFVDLKHEAWLRGVSREISLDFTATHDSSGMIWLRSSDLELAGGTRLLDLLTQITDGEILQWRILPGYRKLQVADNIGLDLTDQVIFFAGRHIIDATSRASRRDIVTDVYVQGKGITHGKASDETARSKWGTRERWITATQLTTTYTCSAAASAELWLNNDERVSRTIHTTTGTGPQPFEDFNVGDTITLDIDGRRLGIRVWSISINLDSNGHAVSEITLQSRFDLEEMHTRKMLSYLGRMSDSIRVR